MKLTRNEKEEKKIDRKGNLPAQSIDILQQPEDTKRKQKTQDTRKRKINNRERNRI